ncbi:acyl-CoA dehydrogenase family protein [Maricaulis sp.]|uniref:acyl-CoA dehydrogenase family protein n=2 Tax=Maricaulis TaxID=74317 RepID=UPI002603ED47|nr:acyl-CoA dehydrogenase family protein [Maricaulis sp.]MDF1768575.1 acyl-CoA dehydrogenase family protein [Maricaulis sp.]
MSDLESFREEVRDWLNANCPEEMRRPMESEADAVWGGKKGQYSEPQLLWLERMAAKGWTVPEWPTEYGGGGLSKEEAKVLRAEMRTIKARSPLQSFGIWMLGPALLKYGTHEQKLEHLPRIARGEIRWAQGYSEPNAGSDLAALMTKCEDKGDHYLINGQKIWTSYADQADWIFALVRTDFEAKKHEGISFILVDMDQPGVTTKPIKLISGKSPFCETFFDDAKAHKHNVIGELNKGWSVAKYLLTHEREMIGGMGSGAMRPAGDVAVQMLGKDESGRLADPILRTDVVRMEIDGLAFMSTMERVTDEAKAGQGMGANSSVLKYYGTELNKRRLELMVDSAGQDGLEWGADDDVAANWLRTKGNSIEGGTSEVQLNIISKRILELPSA